MSTKPRLTPDEKTSIRAGIVAGRAAEDIAASMGRHEQTIRNFASKHGLRFNRSATKRKIGRPSTRKPAPPPEPTVPDEEIPVEPSAQLRMLLREASRRAVRAGDNRDFGAAVKAAADAASALNRLPADEGGEEDYDLGEPDRSLEA